MPASGRSGRDEYLAAHIPGARFLDIDELSRPVRTPRRTCFPAPPSSARRWSGSASAATTASSSTTIRRSRTAARGWFMLRHFGAERVAILDGGLQKWLAEGRPTESGEPRPRDARFDARRALGEVVTKAADRSPASEVPLLDARGKGRFEGSEPDPRPGVAPGHIPGARNLPFGALYREDGTLQAADELRALFEEAGIDPDEPFVASCGSGVTANQPDLRRAPARQRRARLYDGSWANGAPTRRRRKRWARPNAQDDARRPRASSRRIWSTSAWLASSLRLAALLALAEQRLEPGRGRSDQPRRTRVEPALLGVRRLRPTQRRSLVVVGVRRRAAAARIDQPQRMADARQPRDRLGIGLGRAARARAAECR